MCKKGIGPVSGPVTGEAMNDPLIAFGSLLGVGVLVLLNWLLGGWAHARLGDREAVIARWREDFWEDSVVDVLLDRDGRCALIDCGPSAKGLIVARGDGFVTRRLVPGTLRALARPEPGRLVLKLMDFSLPQVVLEAEPDEIGAFLATNFPEAHAANATSGSGLSPA